MHDKKPRVSKRGLKKNQQRRERRHSVCYGWIIDEEDEFYLIEWEAKIVPTLQKYSHTIQEWVEKDEIEIID